MGEFWRAAGDHWAVLSLLFRRAQCQIHPTQGSLCRNCSSATRDNPAEWNGRLWEGVSHGHWISPNYFCTILIIASLFMKTVCCCGLCLRIILNGLSQVKASYCTPPGHMVALLLIPGVSSPNPKLSLIPKPSPSKPSDNGLSSPGWAQRWASERSLPHNR